MTNRMASEEIGDAEFMDWVRENVGVAEAGGSRVALIDWPRRGLWTELVNEIS